MFGIYSRCCFQLSYSVTAQLGAYDNSKSSTTIPYSAELMGIIGAVIGAILALSIIGLLFCYRTKISNCCGNCFSRAGAQSSTGVTSNPVAFARLPTVDQHEVTQMVEVGLAPRTIPSTEIHEEHE